VTSSVLTRMLTEADAAAFRQIQRRSLDEAGKTHEWIPTEDQYAARFKTDWNGQAGFVNGAFDSELVGSICCRWDVAFAPMFWDLYVMPGRRGCGFGERLVRAAVARATEWPGLQEIWLDVVTTNLPARALYEKWGFRPHPSSPEVMTLDLRSRDVALRLGADPPPPTVLRSGPVGLLDLQPPPRRPPSYTLASSLAT
jgi:GNAT superfamily N-acetyltransferase